MEEAWSVPDVYLLTQGAERVAVPQLTLIFLPSGLELEKAGGELVWSCPWDDLEAMAPLQRSVLPDGRDGVLIVVTERGRRRRHRFVLAADDAASTETSIRSRAAAHGLRTNADRPAVSRRLTTLIVIAGAVTLSLLLLSAAHVIHF